MSLLRTVTFTTLQRRLFASLREKAPKITPQELYEPVFENPKIYPEYSTINVRLQSYDFVPLEKFQGYVHRIAKKFKFEIVDCYAVAAQTQKIQTYKPNSTVLDSEIELSKYDRYVRIAQVPSIRLPLFISLIQTHAPIGIEITVKEHEKADEEYRYIPDLLLKEKQTELKALDDPAIRRNLGWE
jgi:ribosomal protein S10